jgi:hypothetical protein
VDRSWISVLGNGVISSSMEFKFFLLALHILEEWTRFFFFFFFSPLSTKGMFEIEKRGR